MTDKEPIIIDDVDVSKCKHFNYGEGYNPETEEFVEGACECITAHDSYGEFMYYGICKERDCYYKQLKRKEEECEELRDELEWLHGYKDILNKEKNDLQMQFCPNCGESFLTPKGAELYDENEKLKQALQKIKEIAKDDCKTCTVKLLGEDEINCKRCYKTKILQKCEVLDERN